jgi:hypothetical protein
MIHKFNGKIVKKVDRVSFNNFKIKFNNFQPTSLDLLKPKVISLDQKDLPSTDVVR